MRQLSIAVLLIGLLTGLLAAGCDRGRTPIPAGAQVIHIAVIESELRLDRETVRAGDVYMVLDTPRSSVGFASRMRDNLEIGPLSDDDIARLARGDTQGLGIGGFDLLGCSNEQRAEDLGLMGTLRERLQDGARRGQVRVPRAGLEPAAVGGPRPPHSRPARVPAGMDRRPAGPALSPVPPVRSHQLRREPPGAGTARRPRRTRSR